MEMKRNYVINFCCALLALILLICGAGVFFVNVKAPKAAQALESMDITKTEPLEYYTAEFLIVDIYSYYGDSIQRSTEYFCYALVKDKYNNTQAVSLSITDKDSLFMAVKGYACNEQAEIGDLIIECAAKAQNMATVYAQTPYARALVEITELLKYSDNSELTGDEMPIMNKLDELEISLSQGTDNVGALITETQNLIKLRSLKMTNIKRGSC